MGESDQEDRKMVEATMENEKTICFRPLLGFQMPVSTLELQAGVWIRKLDNWELDVVEVSSASDIRAFTVEEHSFAAIYEQNQDPRWAIEDQAESIVNCLRLLKPGRVAGAELVDVTYRTRRHLKGVWIHEGLAPKNVVNLEWHYELLREDHDAFSRLWEWYRRAVESGAHWYREAVFRLGESYEEITDEHRAVDLVIALECCVGTRDVEEAAVKGERVLTLVSREKAEVQVLRDKLKELGSLRNAIVHGSYPAFGNDDWSAERITSCLAWGEECVRRCLRKAAALFSQCINLKEEIEKGASVESLRAKADANGAF